MNSRLALLLRLGLQLSLRLLLISLWSRLGMDSLLIHQIYQCGQTNYSFIIQSLIDYLNMQFLKERKLRLMPTKQYTIKDKEFRIKKVSSLNHSNGDSLRMALSPIPSLALLNLKPTINVGVKLKKTLAFPRGNRKPQQRLETTCGEARRGPFLSQCQIPCEVVYQDRQIRPNTITQLNDKPFGGLLRVKSEGVLDLLWAEEKTIKKERVMVHNPFAQRQKRASKFSSEMRESGILRNESCLSAAGECELAGIMSLLK